MLKPKFTMLTLSYFSNRLIYSNQFNKNVVFVNNLQTEKSKKCKIFLYLL